MIYVIALTETWIAEDQLKFNMLDGFDAFVHPLQDGRKSGGVMFYVRKSLKIEEVKKFDITTGEMMKLRLNLDPNSNTFSADKYLSLVVIYRDCKSSRKIFLSELEQVVDSTEKQVIFIGDVNN